MADDDKDPEKDDGEQMQAEGGGIDAAAVIAAIEDGSISVADFEAIETAMAARRGSVEEPVEEMPEEPGDGGPIPMQRRRMSPEVAAMRGELDAVKMQLAERDATDKRTADVDAALERLDGRLTGEDPRGELVAFHRDNGSQAFASYVDSLDKHLAILPDTDRGGLQFSRQPRVPEVAMKYSKDGPQAVEHAAHLSRMYDEQGGRTNMTRERFIELGMQRNGQEA